MDDIQRHIEVVTRVNSNLVAQLREVDQLRDRVRSAEESVLQRCSESDAAAIGAAVKTRLRPTSRWCRTA
jgi:hypothetical protein